MESHCLLYIPRLDLQNINNCHGRMLMELSKEVEKYEIEITKIGQNCPLFLIVAVTLLCFQGIKLQI